jgi:hypothetical protein
MGMYRMAHPLSGTIYTAMGEGLVEVEKDGKRGVFDSDGMWVSGEVRTADPGMCRWMSTAGVPSRHAVGFVELGAETILSTVKSGF